MDFKQFLNDLHNKVAPGSGSVVGILLSLGIGLMLKVGKKSGWKTIDKLEECLEKAYDSINEDSKLFLEFLKTKDNTKVCALSFEIEKLIKEVFKCSFGEVKASMSCDYNLAKDLLNLCHKYNEEHLVLNGCKEELKDESK